MEWTQEQFSQYLLAVLNMAEDGGMDPIGASDMLADVSLFAQHRAIAHLSLDSADVVLADFFTSHRYKRYGGE